MGFSISGNAAECLERALHCEHKAGNANTEAAKVEFLEMAKRWMALKDSFELAERISGYLEWQANRIWQIFLDGARDRSCRTARAHGMK